MDSCLISLRVHPSLGNMIFHLCCAAPPADCYDCRLALRTVLLMCRSCTVRHKLETCQTAPTKNYRCRYALACT